MISIPEVEVICHVFLQSDKWVLKLHDIQGNLKHIPFGSIEQSLLLLILTSIDRIRPKVPYSHSVSYLLILSQSPLIQKRVWLPYDGGYFNILIDPKDLEKI